MLLDVKGVDKKFNGVYALKGLDFSLGEGEVHGLIGENGAGKSTFIKILGGVYKRDVGNILWNGKDLPEVIRPEESRKLGINIIFQDNVLIPAFTGMENICLGRPYPVKGGLIQWKEMEREAAAKAAELGIHLDLKRPVSMMSPAQKKCVEIVRAMMSDCKLLILDEPTVGLDPEERIHFRNLFSRTAQDRLVLLSTHIIEDVQSVCDRLVVIDHGQILFTGTPEQLIQSATGHVGVFWEKDETLEQGLHITARVNTSQGIRCRAVADKLPSYAQAEEPSLEDAYLYLISREAAQ